MLAGRPLERSDVSVGLTDDMMALVEVFVTLARRRIVNAYRLRGN